MDNERAFGAMRQSLYGALKDDDDPDYEDAPAEVNPEPGQEPPTPDAIPAPVLDDPFDVDEWESAVVAQAKAQERERIEAITQPTGGNVSIKRESGPPEVRCYECGQPERVHGVPGPPSPPPYMPCDSFTEPPDRNTLITDVYLTRRQRDEYKREANRWRRELLEIGKRVTRATDEGNFS